MKVRVIKSVLKLCFSKIDRILSEKKEPNRVKKPYAKPGHADTEDDTMRILDPNVKNPAFSWGRCLSEGVVIYEIYVNFLLLFEEKCPCFFLCH